MSNGDYFSCGWIGNNKWSPVTSTSSDDAVSQLIARIRSQNKPSFLYPVDLNTTIISNSSDVISTGASYAQLLGLVAAGALAAGPLGAGIAGTIALVYSMILAYIGQPSGVNLVQLQGLSDILDADLHTYWVSKLNDAYQGWYPPGSTGGVGTYLDNLAAQGPALVTNGTVSTQLRHDVADYQNAGENFVGNLIFTPGSSQYWERPFLQAELFTAQTVEYPCLTYPVSQCPGWYGHPIIPEGALEGSALDPRTMLGGLMMGIQGYLTLMQMANTIDFSQLSFLVFLSEYHNPPSSDPLGTCGDFIYSNYNSAVNGIVKSDIPSYSDILAFLNFEAWSMPAPGGWGDLDWGGSPFWSFAESGVTPPGRGYAWNGVYGAVETYPMYGGYLPQLPVPVPYAAPSYILDVIDDKFVSDFGGGGPVFINPSVYNTTLYPWTLPWATNRVILKTMARWKALYLINGYDKLWSALQNFRSSDSRGPPPDDAPRPRWDKSRRKLVDAGAMQVSKHRYHSPRARRREHALRDKRALLLWLFANITSGLP